ncbi:hypothetical protein KGF56_004089 [Candida oxycetoniae]|uniref:Uncharacterized protein n=1 Tax=Candida oxycetoniae TaxID=497107 RepID=A0AAI9SV18_9ASCO|nr:uncharacterized protein KGF56_004089 [Candida oxycetoniae]KAI3403029.2 hypothetical protein KGF56_004089 [Candida oxycetoniae]
MLSFPKARQIRRPFLIIPIVLLILVIIHSIDTYNVVSQVTFRFKTPGLPISSYSNKPLTILPSNFDSSSRVDYHTTNSENSVIQFNGNPNPVNYYITNQTYIPHSFRLFASTGESSSENDRHWTTSEVCKNLKLDRNASITESHLKFEDDWRLIVKTLINQVEEEQAFRELGEFFQGKLPAILKSGELNEKHFYKFAATSVWLAKHGVHLMVSRIIFSQTAKKNDPQVSLLYAQIYDENWQELKAVDLIVPVVDEFGQREYVNLSFPRFMPIPFYHNAKKTKRRWYGPEDTRLLLSRNEYGDEEPIVVFNAFHRQVIETKNNAMNDDVVNTKYKFFRSMFMGYLFRFQRGKQNTNGIQEPIYENIVYNKIVELRIGNQPRHETEKNWTPFVDPSERSPATRNGDKHIYIVYQWDHLKILRCELANPGVVSHCEVVFEQDTTAIKVGPIRGGTELVSITPAKSNNLEQVWIGFLRAHLNKCGCGKAMYRPNFVVLVKHKNGNFKLSYLSSSISMNIDVDGWNNGQMQCGEGDPNVLIPNGISLYDPKQDYLSLTLSVADKNDNLVHIQGIRQMVDKLDLNWNGAPVDSRQVDCVIDESIDFCKKYGELQKAQQVEVAGEGKTGADKGESLQQDEHPNEDKQDIIQESKG